MLKIYSLFFVLLFAGTQNSINAQIIDGSLINTNHLDHLFQEIEINNVKMGTINIYSDAPDYKLVTDDDEGYTCVDDVARALVFYCRQYKVNPEKKNLEKIKLLSKFIMYMKAPNGYYYNFLLPDKQINKVHPNSRPIPNYWSWRAYWALSAFCLVDNTELTGLQLEAKGQLNSLTQKINLLFQAPYKLVDIEGLKIPNWMEKYGSDQISVILLGLTNYYQINPNANIKKLMQRLGEAIVSMQFGSKDKFPYGAFMSYKNDWHAWGNTQAYALLKAGHELNNETFVKSALKEVDNFYSYCNKQGFLHDFAIKRVNGSIQSYNLNKFPQIAYNLRPMILASIEAYHITKLNKYAVQAGKLGRWFFGNNPANQVMYNARTGVVFDGIDSKNKVNYNSGAESTIEALLSLQAIKTSTTALQILKAKM